MIKHWKRKIVKEMTGITVASSMVLGIFFGNVISNVSNIEVTQAADISTSEGGNKIVISNPRIEQDIEMVAGQNVTWDCINFGLYPQAEIISEMEDNCFDVESLKWKNAKLKIHVKMPKFEDWTKLGVYLFGTGKQFGWSGGHGEQTGHWPGSQMIKEIDSNSWYAFGGTFLDGYYDCIINNYVSDFEVEEGTINCQTKELEIKDGEYWIEVNYDDEYDFFFPTIMTKAPKDYDGKGLFGNQITVDTYGKTIFNEEDIIVDKSLYDRLESTTKWNKNDDVIIDGEKYHRYEEDDGWGDITYRYFKYEPIKWRVLNVNDDKALVLADKVLDWRVYDEENEEDDYNCTWRNSNLREWLNNQFYNSAFSENEKQIIENTTVKNDDEYWNDGNRSDTSDKVFILSDDEVCSLKYKDYGFCSYDELYDEARRCHPTAYAKAISGDEEYWWPNNYTKWWLRSLWGGDRVAYVNLSGVVNHTMECRSVYEENGVRPALTINLDNNSIIDKYTVSSFENKIDVDDGSDISELRCVHLGDSLYVYKKIYDVKTGNVLCEIERYVGEEENVVIPDKLNGYKVAEIGWNAFSNNESLKKVTVPDGIESIPYGAFMACYNLEMIELPESINWIGCIHGYDGYESSFSGCIKLENIVWRGENKNYWGGEYNSIITSDSNKLVFGCSKTVIPDGVKIIDDGAFESCPDTIIIPASVNKIYGIPFYGLNHVSVNNGNKIYDSRSNCNAIIETKTNKLIVGTNNTNIPNTVEIIGEYAFCGCKDITKLIIPYGVKKIEWQAFSDCDSLSYIQIPRSVTSIEDCLPDDCENIVIGCYENSAAQKYAIENSIKYKTIKCNHTYAQKTIKAKPGTNGSVIKTCKTCGDKVTTSVIYAPKTVTLSSSAYTYNGKQRKPVVTVKDSMGKVISPSNYTVTYTNNINVGTTKSKPTVKVTFKGSNYTGTMSKTFTINKANNKIKGTASYSKKASSKAQTFKLSVKATGGKITYASDNDKIKVDSTGKVTIAKNYSGSAAITIKAGNSNYKTVTKKVTITVKPAATNLKSVKNTTAKNASKGKLTVTWNKLSYVTGYEIQYSTSLSFKSGNKIVNVKGASNISKAITGLAKNKTYYVRIRTYKNIEGKKVYSGWSTKKSVKVG